MDKGGQWQQLHRRLIHAQRHIPMYRDLWDSAGIDVRRLQGFQDYASLPLLTRQHLLTARLEDRLDPAYTAARLRPFSTSGSTGEPLQLLFDSSTLRHRQLRFLRALWSSGYRPGQRMMLVSSRPSHSVKSVSPLARLARWHYVDLYDGEASMLRAYRSIRPHVLYAPLNALRMLASVPATLRDLPPPRLLVSTSEQLTTSAARQLELAFGTSVTDFYGLTETGLIAWKPPGAVAYYVAARSMALEFTPLSDGSGCEQLVITEMKPSPMPLFRYQPGDIVRRDSRLPGAPIVELSGKQLDFLFLPDGNRISPYRVDEVLGSLPGLVRYEVLQQQNLDVDVRILGEGDGLRTAAGAALEKLCNGLVSVRVQAWPDCDRELAHKARPIRSLAFSRS